MKLLIVLLYFLVVFLIGYFASRRTHNVSDYILGGRTFNPYVTALGAGASDMSSWLMLALPGAVYINGLNQIWLPIGLIVGAYINWTLVAKRLRVYSELANNALTLPVYLSNRFNDQSGLLRLVMAVTSLVFFTVYAASGLVGFALLFKVLFHFPYLFGLWFGLLSIVFYTCLGGFIAVNWVDVFQGSLMLFALLILPLMIWLAPQQGSHIVDKLSLLHLSYINPFKGISLLSILSLLGWGLGYFGQPHILVRFMAARSSQQMRLTRNICMTWMSLCLLGALLVGLFGAAFYAATPLNRPATVFLHVAVDLFTPALAGILLAAVLSAIMSTISAQLLICSSALIEDIYAKLFNTQLSAKQEVRLNRISLVIIALLALLLAVDPKNSILELVSYAWAGLGAAFGPVILLSLYWRKMTANGALIGMVLGGITVVLWKYLEPLGGIFQIYELIPGFIVCSLGIYFGSMLDTRQHHLRKEILTQHDVFITKLKTD